MRRVSSIYITGTTFNKASFPTCPHFPFLTRGSTCLTEPGAHRSARWTTLPSLQKTLRGWGSSRGLSPSSFPRYCGLNNRQTACLRSVQQKRRILWRPLTRYASVRKFLYVLGAKTPRDQVVSSAAVNRSLKNRCFRVLRKVTSSHEILPKSYYPEGVTLNNTIPHATGGFADIWKGRWGGNHVCVKVFRTRTAANLDKIRRVCAGISHEDELSLTAPSGSIARS